MSKVDESTYYAGPAPLPWPTWALALLGVTIYLSWGYIVVRLWQMTHEM